MFAAYLLSARRRHLPARALDLEKPAARIPHVCSRRRPDSQGESSGSAGAVCLRVLARACVCLHVLASACMCCLLSGAGHVLTSLGPPRALLLQVADGHSSLLSVSLTAKERLAVRSRILAKTLTRRLIQLFGRPSASTSTAAAARAMATAGTNPSFTLCSAASVRACSVFENLFLTWNALAHWRIDTIDGCRRGWVCGAARARESNRAARTAPRRGVPVQPLAEEAKSAHSKGPRRRRGRKQHASWDRNYKCVSFIVVLVTLPLRQTGATDLRRQRRA